jgi:hypothetical protein
MIILSRSGAADLEGIFWAAVKPSYGAAGKTFCAITILPRAESRGFTIHGKTRWTLRAPSPCFSCPGKYPPNPQLL